MAPADAFAEVMDKEPSLVFLWSIAAASALLAVAGCRASPWFALLSAPLPLFYGIAFLLEFMDPSVGPAIVSEGGMAYIVGGLGAALLVVAGHVVGVVLWWRKRSTARLSGRTASGARLG